MQPGTLSEDSRTSSRWRSGLRGVGGPGTAVLAIAAALAVVCGFFTSRLEVKSDLSYLLPESTPSVRQLRALEKRARVATTFMIGVESSDLAARARAGAALLRRLQALDAQALGIGDVTADDHVLRQFVWANRFLFADLKDLIAARDALRARVMQANPLFVSLDAPTGGPVIGGDSLDVLRRKLDDAEDKANHAAPLATADGQLQLILVSATFDGGDLDRGRRLDGALQRQLDDTAREAGPAVHLGMAGDIVRGLAEQRGLAAGMLIATSVTMAAVLAALLFYFRSAAAVLALSWSLTVGVLATFAFTELVIGHLNIASAFLSSIVIGNGINFGIILLGRYFEERRAGHSAEASLRTAMAGTVRSTAAAALAAGTAYLSLAVTPFRGFRDFGIIGGVGMAFCWVSAYTVLPAGLLALERRGWIKVRSEPAVVGWFERALPARPRRTAFVALGLFAFATGGAWRYLTHDPLETNLRHLASTGAELDRASSWMDKFDNAFGHGISSGFALGVDSRQEVGPIVRRLQAADEGKGEWQRLFSHVSTLDDQLPPDQAPKIALLAEIRQLIDRQLRHPDALDEGDRRALARERPPEGLRVLGDADVPAELAWPYVEKDGVRGRIILANNGVGIDSWSTKDLRRFASAVRGLALGPDVLVGGTAFVFTDMFDAIERDGPRAAIVAALGAIVVVLLLVGPGLAAAFTLFCGALGTLALLALASLLGLRVNFLNFVALPITIGIGIDYAVNILSRDHTKSDGTQGNLAGARTASAVALCSFTTVVGYGSLLVSANKGIRSFGLAAMLGEVTCLAAALLVAPALAQMLHGSRRSRTPSPSPVDDLAIAGVARGRLLIARRRLSRAGGLSVQAGDGGPVVAKGGDLL
jgi:uncharacterized protein